jgi:hypothetical protein
LDYARVVSSKLVKEPGLSGLQFCVLLIFGIWTGTQSFSRLYVPGKAGDSARTLGRAIQLAAPRPNDLALLVWSGKNPQEFFYGNRPIREGIWSVEDLDNNQKGATVDLIYGFEQPWRGPATGLVFPSKYQYDFAELFQFLRDHYERLDAPADVERSWSIFRFGPSHAGRDLPSK